MLFRARYVAICLTLAATLTSCDNRASESRLFGTWAHTGPFDETLYYEFQPDHTLLILGEDKHTVLTKAHWLAGGEFIYIRFPYRDEMQIPELLIWHIVDISPSEIRVRVRHDGPVLSYTRI